MSIDPLFNPNQSRSGAEIVEAHAYLKQLEHIRENGGAGYSDDELADIQSKFATYGIEETGRAGLEPGTEYSRAFLQAKTVALEVAMLFPESSDRMLSQREILTAMAHEQFLRLGSSRCRLLGLTDPQAIRETAKRRLGLQCFPFIDDWERGRVCGLLSAARWGIGYPWNSLET